MTKLYDEALKAFKKSFEKFMKRLSDKIESLTVRTKSFSTSSLTLQDNTVHIYNGTSGVSNLRITYPKGDFVSTILLSTAKTGTISITFPENTVYVGNGKLEFFNAEDWEINIHNGRVVGARIFNGG